MTNTGCYTVYFSGSVKEFENAFEDAINVLQWDVDNIEVRDEFELSPKGAVHAIHFTVTLPVYGLEDAAVDDLFEDVRQSFEGEMCRGDWVLDDILIDD